MGIDNGMRLCQPDLANSAPRLDSNPHHDHNHSHHHLDPHHHSHDRHHHPSHHPPWPPPPPCEVVYTHCITVSFNAVGDVPLSPFTQIRLVGLREGKGSKRLKITQLVKRQSRGLKPQLARKTLLIPTMHSTMGLGPGVTCDLPACPACRSSPFP